MALFQHPNDLVGFVSGWFNDEATSDIEVHLKDNQILHCHRIVLCAWSTVWAAALQDKMESSLDVTTHDAPIVTKCLKYCYTSNLNVTDDDLPQVHLFACQYNLKSLQSACENVMRHGVSATNCVGMYCYFLKHEFPTLPFARWFVTEFLCNDFVSAAKSAGFLRLHLEVLCDLLENAPINANEDDILDACCRWLGDSPEPQARERVLRLVRFPVLSAAKISWLASHKLFQPDLKARLAFAKQWATAPSEDARMQLARENDHHGGRLHLTPRLYGLTIQSSILDAAMARTLASMLGGNRLARLLVDSRAGVSSDVFDQAVAGQEGPFVCIVKSSTGHVFGGYVEDAFGTEGGWIVGSPNNFLFSLKNVPPQKVVKLKRSGIGKGIFITKFGLNMTDALIAFCSHSTAESHAFELAPSYEYVNSRTLHGQFGKYTPELMEVFALSPPVKKPGFVK